MPELHRVELGISGKAASTQRTQLRGKRQGSSFATQIERFDSEAIAGKVQPLRLAVPHGQSEHPVEPFQAVGSFLSPQAKDHLDVARASEPVTLRPQLLPELPEIVDFAVEYDRQLSFGEHDRLLSGFEIDDRQPPKTERHEVIIEVPLVVRAAVHHGAGHPLDPPPPAVDSLFSENSGDAAHLSIMAARAAAADLSRGHV